MKLRSKSTIFHSELLGDVKNHTINEDIQMNKRVCVPTRKWRRRWKFG